MEKPGGFMETQHVIELYLMIKTFKHIKKQKYYEDQ